MPASDSPIHPIEKIKQPYLNVVNIPLYLDSDGCWWGDPLWVKDLLLHLYGVEDLRVLCPAAPTRVEGFIPFDPQGIRITTVRPAGRDWVRHLPSLYWQIDREVEKACVVHVGVGGWPFPLGWLGTLASMRHRRFLLIVVESAFWRIPQDSAASVGRRLKASVFEAMARFCSGRANLLVGTQPAYLELAGTRAKSAFLNPASWIDDEWVLATDTAEQNWQGKPGKFVYAGRLTKEKGVLVLLEALRELGDRAPLVDIVGEGALEPECKQLAAAMPHRVKVMPPVRYGSEFFELLDQYSAVVLPICSDEQPRLVFDAYARAVPVLGSSAPGVASCVSEGTSGWLYPPGNSQALANVLLRAAADPGALRTMGMNALPIARTLTHREMHRTRTARLLQELSRHADSASPR